MNEIDRCRPLFIAMLGERYGWVPDGSNISVTEQEIRYGALEAPANTEAFFYLRDKALTQELCDPYETDPRLDDLKNRIRTSCFPVVDGYEDLDAFGKQLYEDLTGAIDRIIAQTPQLPPAAEERENQRFLAKGMRLTSSNVPQSPHSWTNPRSRADLHSSPVLPGWAKPHCFQNGR